MKPDAAFYDLKTGGAFVRMRHDAISRVMVEHVVDQATFDYIWRRQLGNPKAFWAPYPLPSAALDEPLREPDKDVCWGGPTHPSRGAHRCESLYQQMNPETGVFLEDKGAYAPSALTFLLACRHLA